jgi:hypothetical protein
MPQHKPQKQLTQKKEKTQKEEYIYEGGKRKMLRKTTLVLRQNKQVILSSRKPICIPYLAQEKKNLKSMDFFLKKKKSLYAKNLRLRQRRKKTTCVRQIKATKVKKKKGKLLGCLFDNL